LSIEREGPIARLTQLGSFRRRNVIILIAALILCSPFSVPGTAAGADKVILQLRWDNQFQFAGYYAAQWQGYYRDVGLEVEIRSAITPDRMIIKAVDEVGSGRADFGIGAADILVARDQGQSLVLVAPVFQQSAARFYALEKTRLHSPADLLRLRVARNVNDLIDVELQAMLRAEGIDPGQIKAHPHEPGIDHLLDGRVEVIPGYETTIPYYGRRRGANLTGLSPASYGIDFYGDAIFTRQAVAEQKPELVKRFRTASLKGWRYALDHPQEIADRITRELPRIDLIDDLPAFNRFQAGEIPKLTLYPLVELGHVNPERWKKMNATLRTSGIVKGDLDLTAFIYDPEERERKRRQDIETAAIAILGVLALVLATSLLWVRKLSRTVRQRDRALREIQTGEERYRALFEYNPLETVVVDPEGRITGFNLAKRNSGGGQPALGQIMYRDYAPGHALDMYEELRTAIRTGAGRYFPEMKYHEKYLDIRIAPFSGGAMITSIDMTARIKAEARYRDIVDNALEGIFQTTSDGHFIMANQAMAHILGYDSPAELMATFTDIAHQLYVHPEERSRLMQRLRDEGQVHGYEIEFYRKDRKRIWVSSNVRAVWSRNVSDIDYYEGFIQDITELRQAVEFRLQSLDRLRKAMGATIQTLSLTVEIRDPYTAGHQKRVADLARRIATELKVAPERIEGLRMAATVHDIGKVSIPAEILSKPTRLSDLEIKLIRTHAVKGYDILKDIEFPWPVAEIVLQHHERLDGSGYPRGLKGDEITPEARILIIADVVEAMSSHRPYRPALGMEAALAEIETNSGTLYDTEAVKACLRLFREDGYRLD